MKHHPHITQTVGIRIFFQRPQRVSAESAFPLSLAAGVCVHVWSTAPPLLSQRFGAQHVGKVLFHRKGLADRPRDNLSIKPPGLGGTAPEGSGRHARLECCTSKMTNAEEPEGGRDTSTTQRIDNKKEQHTSLTLGKKLTLSARHCSPRFSRVKGTGFATYLTDQRLPNPLQDPMWGDYGKSEFIACFGPLHLQQISMLLRHRCMLRVQPNIWTSV